MSEKWKVDLDAKAEVAHLKAKYEDLCGYIKSVTSDSYKHSIERLLCILRDEFQHEIDSCGAARGSSGNGEKWEEGYIEGLRRAHNRVVQAFVLFVGPRE